MNRLAMIAAISLVGGCSSLSGGSVDDPAIGEGQSYVVTEQCTTTTTCPDGGTTNSVYSYETGPSDWENVADGGAVFTPGGGSGSTGGTSGGTTCAPNPDSPTPCPDGGTTSGGSGGTSGGTSGGDSMCT